MNDKLKRDFGVTAWILTLIILGSFVLLVVGVANGQLDWQYLLPAVASWIAGALASIGVLKAQKQGNGKVNEADRVIRDFNDKLNEAIKKEKDNAKSTT